jgi:hypothetical protein
MDPAQKRLQEESERRGSRLINGGRIKQERVRKFSMEIPSLSFLSSWSAAREKEVHPVFLHAITLLIPVNIYIIGDWMGTGIQWALLRYQETYLGRNVISIFTDSGYILQGTFHGRTALSTGVWILGALLLVLGLLIALSQDREKLRRIRGYSLISGSLLFLLSIVIQYGVLFHGPAGIVIPIGIPALLVMGLILLRPPGKEPVSGKKGPLLSRRGKEILLLFIVCFFVYNTISGNLSGPLDVPISRSQGSGNYYHKGGIRHNINILSMKKVNSDLM